MNYPLPDDLAAQLQDRLATGQYASEEEVLRAALTVLKRQDEEVSAIKAALVDMQAGDRGKLFDEFVEEFRTAHQIARDS
jgi:Arc/MetJ-type ribon-helix-helix transcriptional regulator